MGAVHLACSRCQPQAAKFVPLAIHREGRARGRCSTAATPALPSQLDVHHRQPERPNSILHLSHRAAIQPPAAAAGPLSALPHPIRIGPACHTRPRRRQGCSIVFHDHAHRRPVPGNRSSCQSHLRYFRRRAVSPQLQGKGPHRTMWRAVGVQVCVRRAVCEQRCVRRVGGRATGSGGREVRSVRAACEWSGDDGECVSVRAVCG